MTSSFDYEQESTPVIMCLCLNKTHDGNSCDKCKSWKSTSTKEEMKKATSELLENDKLVVESMETRFDK
jgi:hypothetical protein